MIGLRLQLIKLDLLSARYHFFVLYTHTLNGTYMFYFF